MKNYIIASVNVVLLSIFTVGAIHPYVANDNKNENVVETVALDRPLLVDGTYNDLYTTTEDYKHCDNKADELILNSKNKDYNLITTKIDDYDTFLFVVYNPENIHLITGEQFNTGTNAGKENILDMTKRTGAFAGINAGGFYDTGVVTNDTPVGYIIKDGQILWEANRPGKLIGFNYDNELVMMTGTGEEAIAAGVRDAIEFGPFLVINGERTAEANLMADARAARVILAQRDDGIVLMLVTSGGSFSGPRMSLLLDYIQSFGATNAANLDGGASSQLVINDKLYNQASGNGGLVPNGRKVITGWGVFNN